MQLFCKNLQPILDSKSVSHNSGSFNYWLSLQASVARVYPAVLLFHWGLFLEPPGVFLTPILFVPRHPRYSKRNKVLEPSIEHNIRWAARVLMGAKDCKDCWAIASLCRSRNCHLEPCWCQNDQDTRYTYPLTPVSILRIEQLQMRILWHLSASRSKVVRDGRRYLVISRYCTVASKYRTSHCQHTHHPSYWSFLSLHSSKSLHIYHSTSLRLTRKIQVMKPIRILFRNLLTELVMRHSKACILVSSVTQKLETFRFYTIWIFFHFVRWNLSMF